MEYLLVHRVLPYLRDRFGIKGEIRLRVLKTVGLGESRVGELLADFMERGANPTVGTLAHLGQVDIRIAAKADTREEAERLIGPVEAEIRTRLGEAIFGADETTLEFEIAARLRGLGARLAVVEMGTAGLACERLAVTLPDLFASGFIVGAAGAEGLGFDLRGIDGAEARARHLARAVAEQAGVAVGAATYLEDVPASSPPVVRVVTGVHVHGRSEAREYRFGGDLPSLRIRAATLLLDLIRRSLPPSPTDRSAVKE